MSSVVAPSPQCSLRRREILYFIYPFVSANHFAPRHFVVDAMSPSIISSKIDIYMNDVYMIIYIWYSKVFNTNRR